MDTAAMANIVSSVINAVLGLQNSSSDGSGVHVRDDGSTCGQSNTGNSTNGVIGNCDSSEF